MGVIISGLRMISEPYNHILERARDVYVYSLAKELKKFVNHSFDGLKPLSHKYKEVCQMKEEGYRGGGKLCIGVGLRVKHSNYGYGSIVNNIVPYILKYGDELKKHVRRPIRDDFADAVDLTKELRDYENIEETLAISPRKLCRYSIYESLDVKEKEVRELTLNTSSPKTVIMKSEDGEDHWSIQVDGNHSPAVIEDTIDDVVRLYDMVYAKLAVVRDHNNRITAQMDQIVTPYRLLKAFK